jgi:hypothetical protein
LKDRRLKKSAAAKVPVGAPSRAAKPHGSARPQITANDDNQERSDQQNGSQKQ